MFDGWRDLTAVLTIFQVTSGEGAENVLFLLSRIDRSLLRLSQRHQSVVGTVKSLVPRGIPRELIFNIRVNSQSVLLKHFHATTIIDLIFKWGIHLWCALSLSCVLSKHLHLRRLFESLEGNWVVLHMKLDAEVLLCIYLKLWLCHIFRQTWLKVKSFNVSAIIASELANSSQMRAKPLFEGIFSHESAIELKEVFSFERSLTFCQTQLRYIINHRLILYTTKGEFALHVRRSSTLSLVLHLLLHSHSSLSIWSQIRGEYLRGWWIATCLYNCLLWTLWFCGEESFCLQVLLCCKLGVTVHPLCQLYLLNSDALGSIHVIIWSQASIPLTILHHTLVLGEVLDLNHWIIYLIQAKVSLSPLHFFTILSPIWTRIQVHRRRPHGHWMPKSTSIS